MKNRAAWRNIHFYEASTGEMLGGTYQNGSMTQANFLAILDQILLVVEDNWSVRHRSSGQTIGPTNHPLRLGEYDIYSNGRYSLVWYQRLPVLNSPIQGVFARVMNHV